MLTEIIFEKKWTKVKADSDITGKAFNFTGEHDVYGDLNPIMLIECKEFIGNNLILLIDFLLKKQEIIFKSLLVASLNALSINYDKYFDIQNRSFGKSELNFDFVNADDRVSIIGAGPFIEKLKTRVSALNISDLRPAYQLQSLHIGENIWFEPINVNFVSPNLTRQVLTESDVIIITGSTLVNGTFADLIKMSENAREIAIFGPSANIIPEYFKMYGVTRIIKNIKTKSQNNDCYIDNSYCINLKGISND